MKLEVQNAQGSGTGRQLELPENIFGIEPNEHAVYLAIKAYLANQRQGTHKSKERGEVAGSRKKLHRQKGTGGSRKGDIKNPLFRSGGRVFGPRPRNYRMDINKKVSQLARASAFSSKAAAGKVRLIEDLTMDAPRTKDFLKILSSLELSTEKTLLITADHEKSVYMSSRNIPNAQVVAASDVNTYEVLHAGTVLVAEGAIEKLKEIFA
jgi:large subunit ribosomal protein L4